MRMNTYCRIQHPRRYLVQQGMCRANHSMSARSMATSGSEGWDSFRLGPQAQKLLRLQTVAKELMGGHFGQLFSSLGGPNQAAWANPGSPRLGGAPTQAGEVQELQPGQMATGANGTQVERGGDGVVRIAFTDKCGSPKRLLIQGDRISLDGGQTFRPMGNRGQILKLPNGDVVAIGNAERPGGSKVLSRVAITDSVDRVATDEAGKTNVYDVGEALRKESGPTKTAFSLSFGGLQTGPGPGGNLGATFAAFAGTVSTPAVWRSDLSLSQLGQK